MRELAANKTKIVCTIGPVSESQQVMEQMLLAGVLAELRTDLSSKEHLALQKSATILQETAVSLKMM